MKKFAWVVFFVLVAATFVYVLGVGLAQGADPDCALSYEIEQGKPEPCPGHVSVPVGVVNKLLAIQDERDLLEAQLKRVQRDRAIEAQKLQDDLSTTEGLLRACQGRTTLPCPVPGTLARPEVAWPGGLVLGFVGGFAVGYWGAPH